jgi:hypothetical protein
MNSMRYNKLLPVPENFSQRRVHFQPPIVANESPLSELIHEQIDSRAGGTNHIRQNLVTQDGNLNNRRAALVQMGQPQKYTCEALFRRRSQEVRHVLAVIFDAGEQIGHHGI